MNSITTAQPNEITVGASYQDMAAHDLKEGIRKENSKARSLARKSLEHVRNCGEMLIALKSKVGHGNWKFVISDLNMSQKTVSNYMRIASNWQRVAVLDHGVKDALALLCREDAPPPSPRSSPRPSPLSLTIEAEVVDTAEPMEAKEAKSDPIPKWIPNDAMDTWAVAKTHLDRILPNDISRVKALTEVIEYCRERISPSTSDAEIIQAAEHDKPRTAEPIPKRNPWDISRHAISILDELEDTDTAVLGELLVYLKKRWNLKLLKK